MASTRVLANPGISLPSANRAVGSVASKVFNFGSIITDGFDIETSYQFDLQDYDVPGNFVVPFLGHPCQQVHR